MAKKTYSFNLIALLLASAMIISSIHADTIKSIKVKGLYKIKEATFLAKLPFAVGDELTEINSSRVIRDIYASAFFDDVSIEEEDGHLTFTVLERPTITDIKFEGNKDVSNESFAKILKSAGLVRGRFLDAANLEAIEQSLKTQYAAKGQQNVKIHADVQTLSGGKVKVLIKIDEGSSNKIRKIRIKGNRSFTQRKLIGEMAVSDTGVFTIFTGEDKYAEVKVAQSLEMLTNFYKDRGFANMRVVSSAATKIPNINHMNLSITIDEGKKYTFSGYDLLGDFNLDKDQLQKALSIKVGELYSKTEVDMVVQSLTRKLNDSGYTFSRVDPRLEFDEDNNTIFVTFYINAGRPVYVRRIVFLGNHRTADKVLRREMLQLESSLLSTSKIRESLRKIRNLRYIQDVQIEQKLVVGTNNQMDIIISVEEANIAEVQLNAGASSNGLEVKGGINHYNLYGGGVSAGINFQLDTWARSLSGDYFDPYYTKSGIGRGFKASYRRSKPGNSSLGKKLTVSAYTVDTAGASIRYNIPLSTNNNISAGIGYKNTDVVNLAGKDSVLSEQNQNFVNDFGRSFHQLYLNAGWRFSNYDRYPFPNSGIDSSASFIIHYPAHGFGRYYKLSGDVRGYLPLVKGVVLGAAITAKFMDSYSKDEIVPFFELYRAGGANYEGQVRGFELASLGPRDSKNSAMGGNLLASATFALLLPEPISGKTFRSSIFFDIGNVYQTFTLKNKRYNGTDSGDLRQSAGIGVEWLTPFGPIKLSLAYPFNATEKDNKQYFAISFMSGF